MESTVLIFTNCTEYNLTWLELYHSPAWPYTIYAKRVEMAMKIDLASGELNLMENEPIRMLAVQGVSIRCLSGTIWITLAGQTEDIFLKAGQAYRIGNQRLALIESVGVGRIRVESPPTNTFRERWLNCVPTKWLSFCTRRAIA